MTTTNITTKALKDGEQFFFNNEQHQISIEGDDIRQARVEFSETSATWGNGFQLWFNGQLLNSWKTLTPLKNRLEKLAIKWNLEQGEEL